ncbi:MAG TPA: class I SAM-dependent methyltransferase [Chthoniobacterales bacterium]|jgi:ubiquinone/menaquinone biosynthesis C-methylase UbiE|nr:class I SAM-dependent methyltransferase [Chthoniobacterales bacterium]
MDYSDNWEKFWDERSEKATSDYDFDHGCGSGGEIEKLSEQELLTFIDPQRDDAIFDAGCGTGANILLLSPGVKEIVGMDYSRGATERCQRRIESNQLENAKVLRGSVTHVPLPDRSFDKVLCMSLLQYMDDTEVTCALTEFKRILRDDGVIILHLKNLASIYLATLWAVKRIKRLVRKQTKLEYYRSFSWYVKALRAFGFEIVDYNSFSLFMLDGMPKRFLLLLQKFELQNYNNAFFRLGFLRRHGSELKIKARLKRRM